MHETSAGFLNQQPDIFAGTAWLDNSISCEVSRKLVPINYQWFITAIRKGEPGEPDFAHSTEIPNILDTCFLSDKQRRPITR